MSHIHHLQRRIPQLDNMSRLQRLGVNIVYVVRVEDARFGAAEDGLLTRGIGEAEAAPATCRVSMDFSVGKHIEGTYSGVLLGAQTIAMLSAIIT